MSIDKSKLYDPFAEEIEESAEIKEILDYSDVLATIANYLVEYRIKNNLTQKQFAEILGMKQTMISKLESGRYNPSFKMVLKISYTLSNDDTIFIEIMKKIETNLKKKKDYMKTRMNKNIYNLEM